MFDCNKPVGKVSVAYKQNHLDFSPVSYCTHWHTEFATQRRCTRKKM